MFGLFSALCMEGSKPISHHMETSQQIFTAINGWFQYDGNISLERVGYLPGIVG